MQPIQSKIPVSTSEGIYLFNPDEIIRLEASSNYTYIYFTNRKPMLIAKVLANYNEMLSGMGFLRTHRSHLVNSQYIQFIDASGHIIMQDTSRAGLSRRKKKDVINAIRNHLMHKSLAA